MVDFSPEGFKCHGFCSTLNKDESECTFAFYGKQGPQPNDGGKGGLPGKGGEVTILGSASGVIISSSDGETGEDGKGGKSIQGNKTVIICHRVDEEKARWKLDVDNNYLPNIQIGVDGANQKKQTLPSETRIQIEYKADVINNYKIVLRRYFGNRFRKNILTEFHSYLDNNHEIKGLYRTLDFATELNGLEGQFRKEKLAVEDLVYFYNCLLEQVSDYAENPDEKEQSLQYKKALIYIYTSGNRKMQIKLSLISFVVNSKLHFCSP